MLQAFGYFAIAVIVVGVVYGIMVLWDVLVHRPSMKRRYPWF
jgi:hypothetical protein